MIRVYYFTLVPDGSFVPKMFRAPDKLSLNLTEVIAKSAKSEQNKQTENQKSTEGVVFSFLAAFTPRSHS